MTDTNELQIVNYCHPDCTPMRNILRLPKNDAFSLAQKMADRNKASTAFYRFADFVNYYPLRVKVDQLLRDSFIDLGGQPEEHHPLFFVLQSSSYLENWFDYGAITKILLHKIPAKDISFVYGDSSAVFQRTGELNVFTKKMLLDTIKNFPGSIDDFLHDIEKKHHYIEAQLWNDNLLPENLRLYYDK